MAWGGAFKLFGFCAMQWAIFLMASNLGLGSSSGFALACAAGIWYFRPGNDNASPWRKILAAGMFPLSFCAQFISQDIPPWWWAACAVLGVIVFPRLDVLSAPLWRSPRESAMGLHELLADKSSSISKALDAGAGLGDAMAALSLALPNAKVEGMESAWLPWKICRWRFGASVHRVDLWKESWASYDLVYLFLRPEAMDKAKAKCMSELRAEAWVVCMDFEFEGCESIASIEIKPDRYMRLYAVSNLGEN